MHSSALSRCICTKIIFMYLPFLLLLLLLPCFNAHIRHNQGAIHCALPVLSLERSSTEAKDELPTSRPLITSLFADMTALQFLEDEGVLLSEVVSVAGDASVSEGMATMNRLHLSSVLVSRDEISSWNPLSRVASSGLIGHPITKKVKSCHVM